MSATYLAPTDEYAAVGYADPYDGPVRDLTARRVPRANDRHADMMLAFYSARDAWLAARDNYATGWRTEEADFARLHPRPKLRDFMRGTSCR